jgi:predicted PurR-regulated permease PerM
MSSLVGARRRPDGVVGPFGIDRYSSGVPPDGTAAGDEEPDVSVVDLDPRSVLALLLSLFALTLLTALGRSASRTLTWLAIGALLALALNPVVLRTQERLKIRRSVAVGVVLSTFLGAIAGLGFLLGPPVATQAQNFQHELPRVLTRLQDLPIVGDNIRKNDVPRKIKDFIDNLPERLGENPGRVADAGKSVLSGVLAALAIVLMTITLLLDGARVIRGLRRAVPLSRRPFVDRAGDTFYRVVGRYFAGSLFVALMAGTGVLIMGVILGLPLTPVAALWTASTNLIPQIGGFLGGSLFVALGLTKGPTTAVICLAWFLAWQQLENHVIQPVVVGEAVNLSPPATMLAALIGASAAGVPGALLATPLAGVIKALYLEVRDPERARSQAVSANDALPTRLFRALRRRRRDGDRS